MELNLNVDIKHLTRVEGHGDIRIIVQNGELKEAKWMVVETPRFFEVMLKGKSVTTAPLLTARICGICSIGHALASLRAIENAMEIDPPPLAQKMRLLAKHGETLQSHILHLFFLVAPDFLQTDSIIPIMHKQPQLVRIANHFKKLGNDLCDLTAGRTTHPVTLQLGGVTRLAPKKQIEEILERFENSQEQLNAIVEFFLQLKIPEFVRETEFVSLAGSKNTFPNYPWIGGDLISSDGVRKPEKDYRDMTNEYTIDFSTSKHTKLSRDSFAAGSLARLNNNYTYLHKQAKNVSEAFGIAPVNHNPFMNNIAQLIEIIHVYHEILDLLHDLLNQENAQKEDIVATYQMRAGTGVGAVEVPRGILYHEYSVTDTGDVESANCIIPTTQNNGNIHLDLNALVAELAQQGASDKQIIQQAQMLVRAYDPCISCSVH